MQSQTGTQLVLIFVTKKATNCKLMCMYRFMAGVIAFKRLHRFEIALWRACHAKVFIKHTPIMTLLEDPFTVSVIVNSVHVYYHFYREKWFKSMYLYCFFKENSFVHE